MITNPFTLLDLPLTFDLDLDLLETQYFKAQRMHHPDQKGGMEEMSAALNQAYGVLKHPRTRGIALLEVLGESLPPATPKTLMQAMTWGERVVDGEDIQGELNTLRSILLKKISEAFRDQDLNQAGSFLVELQYLEKAGG